MTRTDRILLTLGALGCLACVSGGGSSTDGGPAGDRTMSVTMQNDYAESLFTVSYSFAPDGGAPMSGIVMTDERIEAGASKTVSNALTVPVGAIIDWTVVGTSLGDQHTFTHSYEVKSFSSDCEFTYDYDLALAKFRVGARCF